MGLSRLSGYENDAIRETAEPHAATQHQGNNNPSGHRFRQLCKSCPAQVLGIGSHVPPIIPDDHVG
jgi:hypothetical protein